MTLKCLHFGVLYWLLIIFVKETICQFRLSIIQHVGTLETPITRAVKVSSGTNFSLICKTVNADNNHISDPVTWIKIRSKTFKPGNNVSDLNSTNEKRTYGVNLRFNSVHVEDGGLYMCSNQARKLYEVVSVQVTPVLQKNVEYGDHYQSKLIRSNANDWDLNSRTYEEEKHQRMSEIGSMNMLLKLFFLFLGIGLITLIVFVIVKCCQEDSTRTSPRNRNASPRIRTPRPSSQQSTPTRRRYQEDTVRDTRLCIPRISVTDVNHYNDDGVEVNHLDLPPTYDESTQNSRASSIHNLNEIDGSNGTEQSAEPPSYAHPPSYADALEVIFVESTTTVSADFTSNDYGGGDGDD